MYGYICERCGAHLDPGEPCDCLKEEEIRRQKHVLITSQMDEMLETECRQLSLLLCS